MKWLIIIAFISGGKPYTDAIPMGAEVTTERQCMMQAQPVVAMWANAQPGDVQVVKFTCRPDNGEGRA